MGERMTTCFAFERPVGMSPSCVGYQYLDNVGKPDENRIQFALTSRFELPWSLVLADRNRADLRFINDQFSWRYRNRLTLQRQPVGYMEQKHLLVRRDVPDSQAL
jgi:hypothetical protein